MKKILSALLVALTFTACSKSEETILGKTYALLPEKTVTITFDRNENRFFGKALNNYFGEYKIEQNNLTLTVIGSTMMAGPEEEMKNEIEYFKSLGKVKSYTLKNKTLELTGEGVNLKYEEAKN